MMTMMKSIRWMQRLTLAANRLLYAFQPWFPLSVVTLWFQPVLVHAGEYCKAFYDHELKYHRGFYCRHLCCGQAADKFCCNSISHRLVEEEIPLSASSDWAQTLWILLGCMVVVVVTVSVVLYLACCACYKHRGRASRYRPVSVNRDARHSAAEGSQTVSLQTQGIFRLAQQGSTAITVGLGSCHQENGSGRGATPRESEAHLLGDSMTAVIQIPEVPSCGKVACV